MRLAPRSGQELRGGGIFFIELAEAADCGGARGHGLAKCRPFAEDGDRFVVTERSERAQSGVTQKIVRRFTSDGGGQRGKRSGRFQMAESLEGRGARAIGFVFFS